MTRVPTTTTPRIKELCQSLVAGAEPLFVPSAPSAGAAQLDCFITVQNHVDTNGGTVCYGWQIWESPRTFIEAEFHAVWRKQTGALVDIAAKQVPTPWILFLPDPQRQYEGKQVNNVRLALRPSAAIQEWFAALDARFEFENRGARALQHQLVLTPPEEEEYTEILGSLKTAVAAVAIEPVPAVGRNDPCLCGSGTKSKKCCGQ